MSCLFCQIAQKNIPADIVYEDETALAVADINPRAPGHSFIIPKNHAPTILDLPDEDIGPLFMAVKKTAAKIKSIQNCDGFTIGMNQGRASGQEVDHLHIHIIPRWHNDGGHSVQSVVGD